jgi:outer membrane protein TolC
MKQARGNWRTARLATLLFWGFASWIFLPGVGAQAPPERKPGAPNKGEQAPPPRAVPPSPTYPTPTLPTERVVPITLTAALQLAVLSNLDIAQAREVVNQSLAVQLRARLTAVPNLQMSNLYNHHEGQIQNTAGNISTINRDSLWDNTGPIVIFQLVDAIYQPLLASRLLDASRAGARRVNNDTLLAVADAYFAVMRARRRIARIEDTMNFLTSDQPSPLRAQSRGLLPVMENFVEVGGKDALRSELERVRVEILRRQEEMSAAILDFIVASAELSRLLHLDPELLLFPVEDFRFPLPLPGDGYSYRSTDELIEIALSNRPELAENRALVAAALARIRTAKWRPFMPTLALSYNWGGFGGGPNPIGPEIVPGSNPPKSVNNTALGSSGHIDNYNTRTELDAAIVWRLQNMGLGNRAEIREQEAVYRRSQFAQVQLVDRVITQVVQSQALVDGWRQRVDITRLSLFGPNYELDGSVFQSLRLNFERVRAAEGRPLEVLDSIRSLSDLLDAYGQSVTDYERARFRLLISMGIPPDELTGPPKAPVAPAPPRTAPLPDKVVPENPLP